MSTPKWENTTEITPEAAPKWDDTIPHVEESPSEEVGKLESFGRGGAQGATLGFADEIAGGGEAVLDILLGKAKGKGISDLYTQHRDESRDAFKRAADANPLTSMAGNITGSVLPSLAMPAFSTVKGAAAVGALGGAATGLGTSEAEDLSGLAKDTTIGGGVGAVTGGALQGLINKLNPTALNEVANNQIVKASGATKPMMREMVRKGQVDDVANSMFEHNIAPTGSHPEQILDNFEALKQTSGQTIGNILDMFDKNLPSGNGSTYVNAGNLRNEIAQIYNKVANEPALADKAGPIGKILESIDLRGNGPITFKDAQTLKNVLKEVAYTDDGKIANKYANAAYGILNKHMEDAAEATAKNSNMGPALLENYLKAKKDYTAGILGGKASLDKTAALMTNRQASLSDYLAGVAGAATGGPVGGLVAAGANNFIKTHANTAIGNSAKTASQTLTKINDTLFKSTADQIKNWGTKLVASQSPAEQKLGTVLIQASQKDNIGRNALLFTLMQQPAYRQILGGFIEAGAGVAGSLVGVGDVK
jgi:hypothetical protein